MIFVCLTCGGVEELSTTPPKQPNKLAMVENRVPSNASCREATQRSFQVSRRRSNPGGTNPCQGLGKHWLRASSRDLAIPRSRVSRGLPAAPSPRVPAGQPGPARSGARTGQRRAWGGRPGRSRLGSDKTENGADHGDSSGMHLGAEKNRAAAARLRRFFKALTSDGPGRSGLEVGAR